MGRYVVGTIFVNLLSAGHVFSPKATSILNHPQPSTPNFSEGGTPLCQIGPKCNPVLGAGRVQRNFQAHVRLTF